MEEIFMYYDIPEELAPWLRQRKLYLPLEY
jgi:hypothetical protein